MFLFTSSCCCSCNIYLNNKFNSFLSEVTVCITTHWYWNSFYKSLNFCCREWIWQNCLKFWFKSVMKNWKFSSCTADTCWMFLQVAGPLWPMGEYWDHWKKQRSLHWMTFLSWRGSAWTAMEIRSSRPSERRLQMVVMVIHTYFCSLYVNFSLLPENQRVHAHYVHATFFNQPIGD